tara:strand:- start:3866 stop:4198 length:333 start_codon:yes stop_codon:yes gene_type:complete
MFQNTKNTLNDTFNTLFYETSAETFMKHYETLALFSETGMFHLCFTGNSSKSLKLFIQKMNAIHRETDMFQEMFHKIRPLYIREGYFQSFETFFWNKMSFTGKSVTNHHY